MAFRLNRGSRFAGDVIAEALNAGEQAKERQRELSGPTMYSGGSQEVAAAPNMQRGGMSSEFAGAVSENPDYFYGDKGYMARLGLLESTKINGWNIGGGPAPDSQVA